jgi:hypothetical protein
MTDTSSPPFEVLTAPLSEMRAWPRNPKLHDVGAITSSFERFGYVAPIVVNRANNMILAGHGRVESLASQLRSGSPPPARITDISAQGSPDWLVPYIAIDLPEELHEAYVVTDNRLVQLGGWDEPTLIEVLMDLKDKDLLEVTGYDGDDLDWLIQNHGIPPQDGTALDGETFNEIGLKFEISCIADTPAQRDKIVATLQNLGVVPEIKTLREFPT